MADKKPKSGVNKPPMAPKPRPLNPGTTSSLLSDEAMKKLMEHFNDKPMEMTPGSAAWKSKFNQLGESGVHHKVVTHSSSASSSRSETKVTRTSTHETKVHSKFHSLDPSNSSPTGSLDSVHSTSSLGSDFSHQSSVKHSFGSLKRRFENFDSTEKVKNSQSGSMQHTKIVQKVSTGGVSTTEVHFNAGDVQGEKTHDVAKNMGPKSGIGRKEGSTSPRIVQANLEGGKGVVKTGSPKTARVVNQNVKKPGSPRSPRTEQKLKHSQSGSPKSTDVSRRSPGVADKPKIESKPNSSPVETAKGQSKTSLPIKVVHVSAGGKQGENNKETDSGSKDSPRLRAALLESLNQNRQPPKEVLNIPVTLAKVETSGSDSSSLGSEYDDVLIPPPKQNTGTQKQNQPTKPGRQRISTSGSRTSEADDFDEVYVRDGRIHFFDPESKNQFRQEQRDAENNNFNVPIRFIDDEENENKAKGHNSDSDGYEKVEEFVGDNAERERARSLEPTLGEKRTQSTKTRTRTDPGFASFSSSKKAQKKYSLDSQQDRVSSSEPDDDYELVEQVAPPDESDGIPPELLKKFGRKALTSHMQAFKKKVQSKLFSKEELLKNNVGFDGEKLRSYSQPDAFSPILAPQLDPNKLTLGDTDKKVRSLSDINRPKLSVFSECEPPNKPPPRLKKNSDLDAVIPPPKINTPCGPNFPDGYLGNPQIVRSCENLVSDSNMSKKDLTIDTRPPAVLPRDAPCYDIKSSEGSMSRYSRSWSRKKSHVIEQNAMNRMHLSPSFNRRRSQVIIKRASRSGHSAKTRSITKVQKADGYLHMSSVTTSHASSTTDSGKENESDSDDDYFEAHEDFDILALGANKAFEDLWNQKGTKFEFHTQHSSYLELVDDSITRLQRVNRFKSRFGDEAPLYQIYHRKLCFSSLSDGRKSDATSDSDDEEDIYSSFSGPTSPLAIEPPVERCESPVLEEPSTPIDFTTPTLQVFDTKLTSAVRSLWCEMPEVKQSGALDKLSPQERKLQETLFEIITSEASYQKSLLVLINNFLLDPMFSEDPKKCVINKREKHFIFSNVVAVMESSEGLLRDLESMWQKSCILNTICDVVGLHASKNFDVYVRYCSNQMYQTRTLTKLLEENREFRESLHAIEKNPVCQGLPIKSFLLLPMQRITRLPLLIDAVCHRCDEEKNKVTLESAKKALETIQGVVKKCNEGARHMERMEQMVEIDRSLKFKVKKTPLISASRYLVKKGELLRVVPESTSTLKRMVKGKVTKQPVWLFLFNDLLMLTKKKGDQYVVFDYCSRISLHVELVSDPDNDPRVPENLPSAMKNLFVLALLENHANKQVEFILSAESTSDRARWIEVLSPAKEESNDTKVYESWDCPQVQAVFQYEAQQPDELSLDESDVVNVIRKMGDGWFEGERIRDGQKGWFPSNHTMEIMNAHVRAKNLKQRYRLNVRSQAFMEQAKK